LRWFNRFLRGSDPAVPHASPPVFAGPELRVLEEVPGDEITSHCHDSFTRVASEAAPLDPGRAIELLGVKTFGGWPASPPALDLKAREMGIAHGIRLTAYEFTSEHDIRLRLLAASPGPMSAGRRVRLRVLDGPAWEEQRSRWRPGFGNALEDGLPSSTGVTRSAADEAAFGSWAERLRRSREVEVVVLPRGVGPTAPGSEVKSFTQLRRRFQLLGQTLAGMQVWDVRRAIQAVRGVKGLGGRPCTLEASSGMTEVAAFAVLFEPGVVSLRIPEEPRGDHEAPDFLNWSRVVTPRQLLALARSRCEVVVGGGGGLEAAR
jgi:hypothetical protein